MLSWFRREMGQDLIEYALVLPIVMALMLGIVDFGLAVFSYNTIANAAREGARYGTIQCNSTATTWPHCNKTDVSSAARLLTVGLAQNSGQLNIDTPGLAHGAPVQVVVTYRVDLLPFIAGFTRSPSINLRAVSTMQTE
jgi:Flp pilus assembly protein TadG